MLLQCRADTGWRQKEQNDVNSLAEKQHLYASLSALFLELRLPLLDLLLASSIFQPFLSECAVYDLEPLSGWGFVCRVTSTLNA